MKKPSAGARLAEDQWEIVGQFNDYSFEYPQLNCDSVAKKALGPKPFPSSPAGRKFRAEAKAMFDLERKK
jgi:hypothetical protein